ncbi:putative 2-aminoethylphosphonate ABC transporter ATP-binding protein [Roseomonas hellenica]|nr:putative 2-aminoethylphosphonate ABC transporter ATP-binding protein [Plastoroseomonas hellenica]
MGQPLRRQVGAAELMAMRSGTVVAADGAAARQAEAPYLVVRQVAKSFGTFAALHRVSLAIDPGEFVAFLGPSGCGKTTLLRAIAGLDPPSSGTITQAGRDITALPPEQRDFGIVFQSYALFPNLTVARNIAYGLRGRAWPRDRAKERVAELLVTVGLPEQADKYPAQLSGGQQQRVALARALANEPGLLLLDEPLSALDAIVRVYLRQELRSLQRRLGVTTIMVTHDQEEAMSVSDRIVVMSQGRIEQIGTPEEVYRRPTSPFVAGFVGRSSHFNAKVDTPAGMLVTRDGLRIEARGIERLLYGQPVEVFVRPEDVRIGPEASVTPRHLEGQVVHVEFMGALARVSLEVGRLRLDSDVPAGMLGALGAFVGAALPVALPPESLMIFPTDV